MARCHFKQKAGEWLSLLLGAKGHEGNVSCDRKSDTCRRMASDEELVAVAGERRFLLSKAGLVEMQDGA